VPYVKWDQRVHLFFSFLQSEGKGAAAEVVKALPPAVMKRIEALSELQSKFAEQHKTYVAEYKELQKKYHAIYSELWNKRAEIVNGKVDPAGAAGKFADPFLSAGFYRVCTSFCPATLFLLLSDDAAKGVEGFWLQALQNGRRTGPTIEEHDEPALKALTDITLEYLDDFQVSPGK
jgi:nucleosome assembly protein 1-like 1